MIDLDIDMDINKKEYNTKNIACLRKIMSIHNKQHLSNMGGFISLKLSNTDAELKNALPINKACILKNLQNSQ